MVLLPGTKNTMADLRWLRNNGLEERIIRLSKDGVSVMGVCGGYQMLGSVLSDPEGVEDGGEMAGMGLLPGQTIFREEKTRTRICGAVINGGMKGCPVEGYEIHMGDTRMEERDSSEFLPWLRLADGRMDGMTNRDGTVMGTYLHGIFDEGDFLNRLIEPLMERYHLNGDKAAADGEFDRMPDMKAYKEAEYDKLANLVRKSLDMEKIYQIMGGRPDV